MNVSFDGGSSSDADGSIVSYAWNFGDSATGSRVTTNHTYPCRVLTARASPSPTTKARAVRARQRSRSIPFRQPFPPLRVIYLRARYPRLKSRSVVDRQFCQRDRFRIERCAGANCTNFVEITTVGANIKNYTNTGLKRNTTYRYRVRAFNSAGPPLTRTRPPLQHRDEPSETGKVMAHDCASVETQRDLSCAQMSMAQSVNDGPLLNLAMTVKDDTRCQRPNSKVNVGPLLVGMGRAQISALSRLMISKASMPGKLKAPSIVSEKL